MPLLESSEVPVDCPSCGNKFQGKFCHFCGEKIFHPDDLSLKKFLSHTVDMFTHLDTKFFASLKYLLFKPGFLTKSYISGARVKYAKPIQIFLLVNLFFYFVTHYVGATDYTPNYGDHHFYLLSDYRIFGWLSSVDNLIVNSIDQLGLWTQNKLKLTQDELIVAFHQSSWVLSKIFVFLLIPLYALVFWALLYRRLHYFGAAMIFAAHFVAFQLVLYSLTAYVYYGLWFNWLKPLEWFFFESPARYVGHYVFHNSFELSQIVIWCVYLFFAFQLIGKRNPLFTMLLAFIAAKILFFVTFGIYKKILIVMTLLLVQ